MKGAYGQAYEQLLETNRAYIARNEEEFRGQIRKLQHNNKLISALSHGPIGAKELQNSLFQDIVRAIGYNTSLIYLELCIRVTPKNDILYKKLLCSLTNNPSITDLCISKSCLNQAHVKYLERVFTTNIQIKHLDFY